jgi:uncharacterized protein YcbK (DUF882 family)
MHHMHTGEDINITYKRNGHFDDEALEKINWFLRDWRKQEKTRMDPHLLDIIWEVNRETGGNEPIQIVCGYRSPTTNAMLRRRSSGVARFSQHTLGKATDFYIPGVSLEQLRYAGLRLQRGGVGYYPTSGSPFVHLDTGNVRHWPRMAPEMLARVLHDRPTQVARTRKPATDHDLTVADAQKPKRGFLAKLFGFGTDEGDDEDAEYASASAVAANTAPANSAPANRASAHVEPAKPAQVAAAAVPIPSARPTAKSGQFTLASTSSRPVTLPPAAPSPADIVSSRADWRGQTAEAETAQAAPAPGAIGGNGQRFQWIAGPPGRPIPPADIPQPKLELATAADTTGGLGGWPDNAHNDRVPTDLVLAYAAPPPAEPRTRSLSSVVDVPRPGAVAKPAPVAAVAPLPAPSATSSLVQKSAPRINNPWLRAIVMAPSAYYSMRVALLGAPDYRGLAPLMHKPRSAIAMVFTVDPHSGLSTEYFGGPAVSFVPTITFGTRTAALN